MRLFIYLDGAFVEKKANLMAVSDDVKDETLDTAQVQIMFDEREEEYPPRTLVKITESGVDNFYNVALDNVGVQTLEPRTFRHKMNLVQTTRALSHYVLPNMVVTKPREGTASTYFRNENALNPLFYYYVDQRAQAPYTWGGFATRYVSADISSVYRKTQPSPYWGECLALTKHTTAIRARIKVFWEAFECSYNSSTEKAVATFKRLSRDLARPSWLSVYLRVYHTSKNINTQEDDRNVTDIVEIAKININEVTWGKDYGYIDLTSSQLEALNAYTSGYVMCDLISEATGTVPTSLLDPTDATPLTAVYDRLFADETEFTSNGLQTIWSNVSLELSYKKASLYDTLQKILDRQALSYDGSEATALFRLPTSGDDYETLVNTESPEFTFSNLTVFEAVSQVLETIDALPRFEVQGHEDLLLKLDYYASRGSEIPSDQKFVSFVKDASEQKRDNGVLTNFQNAEVVSTFPLKPKNGIPVYARCRVTSYGTPEYTDFALALDKPVKYINHLWLKTPYTYRVLYKSGTRADGYANYLNKEVSAYLPIDIAPFIYDDGTYSSALDQGATYPQTYNHNIRMQMNCLKFKQGAKAIAVGNKATDQFNHVYNTLWNCWNVSADRATGRYAQNHAVGATVLVTSSYAYTRVIPVESSFREVYFACEYGTDLDGRLEIQSPYPKEEGQFLASATGSSPDIGKLGLNMLGVSLKSGEPTMTCGQTVSSYENRIKVGQTIKYDGATWVATKASYVTLGEGVVKGTIEFTKNFNGLSRRITIDQSKRLYAIDRGITQLCEANITNYVYFEPLGTGVSGAETAGACVFPDAKILDLIMKPFTDDESVYGEVSCALVSCPSEDVNYIYMPIAVYGAGNCLCFEGKFDDPISAGVAMKATQDGSTGWWATDAYNQLVQSYYYYGYDVKYADAEGYATYFNIQYLKNDDEDVQFDDTFPHCPNFHGGEMGSIENLWYNKQPNEIFGLNFELAFLSKSHTDTSEVFFGKRFFDAWDEKQNLSAKELYFYYSETDLYAPTDQYAKGNGLLLRYASKTADSSGKCYIDFYTSYLATKTDTKSAVSWAVADENGKILVACNHSVTIYFQRFQAPWLPRLHFFARTKRI